MISIESKDDKFYLTDYIIYHHKVFSCFRNVPFTTKSDSKKESHKCNKSIQTGIINSISIQMIRKYKQNDGKGKNGMAA